MKPSPTERARAYLATMPVSIAGQGGHDTAFKTACKLMHGFALALEDALPLLAEWNQACQPPWSDTELRHKLADALKAAHQRPRGYLLASEDGRPIYKPASQVSGVVSASVPSRPDRAGFTPGTSAQLKALTAARPFNLEGLQWANERGVLIFGCWHGFDCYGISDKSGRVLELRRVDGQPFPAVPGTSLGERKSHAVKHSQKSWPLGILEARDFPAVALVEGGPDFLAAHCLALWEQASHYAKRDPRCAPVAMLSASPAIDTEALPHFVGKHVRLFPHVDTSGAGTRGAARWEDQLRAAGAARVDVFDFTPYRTGAGEPVKDLWEFDHKLHPDHFANPDRWRMLP